MSLPRALALLLGCACTLAGTAHAATDDDTPDPDRLELGAYVAGSHDDNLFRLSDGVPLPAQVAAAGGALADTAVSAGATLASATQFGRQQLRVDADVASVRYRSNRFLDYVSGKGALAWDWQAAHDLSGTLRGGYTRFLAGFANRPVGAGDALAQLRDVVQVRDATGTFNAGLGSHWSLRLGAGYGQSRHDSSLRGGEDADTTTGSAALVYTTRLGRELGASWWHAHGQYVASGNDYDDDAARLQWKLPFGDGTVLAGNAGWLRRSYAAAPTRGYSGGTWNATLDVQGGGRSSLGLAAWRELRAWQDVGTDHYVSTGGRIRPAWNTGLHWQLALEGSWEKQRYLGDAGVATREDTLEVAGASVEYAFLRHFRLTVGGRYERRESDLARWTYEDRVLEAGLQGRW